MACLTTVCGGVLRDAVGGGKAWISSLTKRCGPGAMLDIPLAHKDALYVRSHYDGMTITVPDAPLRMGYASYAASLTAGGSITASAARPRKMLLAKTGSR